MFFKDIIGQEKIKERLIKGVQMDRVSHAQLFLGENGTGGLPLALAYAQYVNCENRGETDSCGVCHACRKTMALEHPDLHFTYPVIPKKSGDKPVSTDYIVEWRKALRENVYLDYADWMGKLNAENKQGNITAEECRDIFKKLSLTPVYEGFKIIIIWMPEFLSKEGNRLLKLIEEPPPKTVFLLVAENEELILTTILSRTQISYIPKIESQTLRTAIMERFEVGGEEADRITFLASGNFRTAMRVYEAGENDYTNQFVEWMRLCYALNGPGLLKWVDEIAGAGRENQKNFLLYGLGLFRECMLNGYNLNQISRVMESEKDFVGKFSKFINERNIYQMVNALNTNHYHIERNAHPKILFFNLSLQISELLRA